MPKTENSAIAGIVLTDGATKPVVAAGIGADPRVASLIADKLWMDEVRERRLVTLNLDRKSYTVLLAPAAQGWHPCQGLERFIEATVGCRSSLPRCRLMPTMEERMSVAATLARRNMAECQNIRLRERWVAMPTLPTKS